MTIHESTSVGEGNPPTKKAAETKTYSGVGPSNAPFGTRYALGVTNSWRAGTASECIIPTGWRLVSGTTLCYAHGRCPQGNAGNLTRSLSKGLNNEIAMK